MSPTPLAALDARRAPHDDRPPQVIAQRRGHFGLSRALEALEVFEALALERVRAVRTGAGMVGLALLSSRVEAARQLARWALAESGQDGSGVASFRSRLLSTAAEAAAGDACLRAGALAGILGLDDEDLQQTVHDPRVRAFAEGATDEEVLEEVAVHGLQLVAPARGSFEAAETVLRALLLGEERQLFPVAGDDGHGLGGLVVQVLAVRQLESARGPRNPRGALVPAMGDLLRSWLASAVLATVIARQDLRLPDAALERCHEQAGEPAMLEAQAVRLGQRLLAG
jgi:hypothetical protein